MKKIRIISDGTTCGTRILNADGVEISGISKITILADASNPDEGVTAILEAQIVELDIVANVDAIPEIDVAGDLEISNLESEISADQAEQGD
ncbi:hypothetical protein [uncultured Desulfuromonas sp.]|uniref:hypothetical protein n=1 Tax=uncultured Desulfuromonas sp. TaxID=181013 RepID=UPI002AAAF514|nr:hypothetical protein [uncultured Desulfuromonas sp.]